MNVKAWPGSQQAKGRAGETGGGQGCVFCQCHSESPRAYEIPGRAVLPQPSRCPALPVGSWGSSPGSAGRPLSARPRVLPPQGSRNGCISQSRHSRTAVFPPTELASSWAPASCPLSSPFLCSSSRSAVTELLLWALPRTNLVFGQRARPPHSLLSLPFSLSSDLSNLSCSCPLLLSAPPPPCASLTLFPSCPKGSTIFIATFLYHMIPQSRVWSQQKAITLLGLNIRCEQEGNSWRRGRGQGEGGGITDRATSTETGGSRNYYPGYLFFHSSPSHAHPVCNENKGQWASSFSPQIPGVLKTEQQL